MENTVAIATPEEAVATSGVATSVAGKNSDVSIISQMNVKSEERSSDRPPREENLRPKAHSRSSALSLPPTAEKGGASTFAAGATVSAASLAVNAG